MLCRKLDENGDYSFGTNEQDFIDGVDAIAQTIKTKILLFYGEWWENLGIGIPMFQSLLGQMNPEGLKMSSTLLISKSVREVEGVTSISKLDVLRNKRNLRFDIVCETNEGKASVEVIV